MHQQSEVVVAYNVGEEVVYPYHGIAVVEEIQMREVGGGQTRFYILRLAATGVIVMVPVENAHGLGVRRPIGGEEGERLLRFLSEAFATPPTAWKARYDGFFDKARTGDVFAVAEVVKGLTYLGLGKPLSSREKRLLERVRLLVVSEVAFACRAAEVDIEPRVDEALAIACANHTCDAPRAEA